MRSLGLNAFSMVILAYFLSACTATIDDRNGDAGHSPTGPDLFHSVREHIVSLVDEEDVPSMAEAVVRSGEIVWEEGFGLANRKDGIAASEHTSYPIASISKPFTATGLMIIMDLS